MSDTETVEEVKVKRGRVSELSGKKLHSLKAENPRRAGTNGWRSMEIIIANPGISTEDFQAQGGRLVDLKWDIDKGNVEVRL
jgi:hypothetical protein